MSDDPSDKKARQKALPGMGDLAFAIHAVWRQSQYEVRTLTEAQRKAYADRILGRERSVSNDE